MESASLQQEFLVLALFSVDGATAACAAHGDLATVSVLARYYTTVAANLAPAGGHVIKVMGDGLLAIFPPESARAAEAMCRRAQDESAKLWQAVDPRCAVRVKLGAGTVVRGGMGPAGEERADIYGQALNDLYKASGDTFLILPPLAALLHSGPVSGSRAAT